MGEEIPPIVIDHGTFMTRAGYGCDDAPRSLFETVVGTWRTEDFQKSYSGLGYKDFYVGDEARYKRGVLNLKKGANLNDEDLEKLYHHIYQSELRIDSAEQPTLITAKPLDSQASRHKKCQTFFETFNVPAWYLADDATLSLYASGRTTGLVVDMGQSGCRATPIYEGFSLTHNIFTNQITPDTLTDFLFSQIKDQGWGLTKSNDYEVVSDTKQKYCYVAENFKKESERAHKGEIDKAYELPKAVAWTVGYERIVTTEVLFQPDILDFLSGTPGLDKLVFQAVAKSPRTIRKDLAWNIILSGGNSMFPGLSDRLKIELEKQFPFLDANWEALDAWSADKTNLFSRLPAELLAVTKTYGPPLKTKVIAPPERKFSCWIGGSILCSLSTFNSVWVTKEHYDEMGTIVVDRMCLF